MPLRHRRLVFGAGQDLRQVHGGHPGALPAERAADVHQAGVVGGAQHLGLGLLNGGNLVGAHRGGDVGVLYGERAAEAAAGLRRGQLGQLQPAHFAQQPQRRVAHPEHPQRMAGGVIGHPVREVRTHVGHPQHVHQQGGQVVNARREAGHGTGQGSVAGFGGKLAVVLADHRGTGGRRAHDDVELREGLGEPPRQRQTLPPVATVEMHLAAAGLPLGELHLMAEPLEQRHDGPAGGREQGVGETRDEQGYPHRHRFLARRGSPRSARYRTSPEPGRPGRAHCAALYIGWIYQCQLRTSAS